MNGQNNRRDFIKNALAATALTPRLLRASQPTTPSGGAVAPARPKTFSEVGSSGVAITENQIRVETTTLSATFERGVLVSVVRKSDGRQLLKASPKDTQGVFLVYQGGEPVPQRGTVGDAVPLGNEETDRFTPHRINDHTVEVRIEAWHGDGVMTISDDPENGDLVVELGAYSSRPGFRAARWLVSGIDPELELVAPFFQGVKLPLEDPLIRNSFWHWPHRWEAPLAILQGSNGGFWVTCRDTRFLYKSFQVGTAKNARALGFDTEVYGPTANNISAGGVAWRLNVYEGDWKVPAAKYRDWLSAAYGLKNVSRPAWMNEIRLALAWCPTDTALLDALARRIAPGKVLLHVTDFRTNQDGEGYPDFTPSERGIEFVRKTVKMGFHPILHFPALDLDPTNPAYNLVGDFKYRELETKQTVGWTRRGEGPVPESNADLLRHQGMHLNVRMHPGLSMWRSVLAENIAKTLEILPVDAVFLDVAMNIHNVDNGLVENAPPTLGMVRLQETIQSLNKGLIVTGEGRNDITMQRQAFGQVHLFKSWRENIPGLERLKPCPLSEFLFGSWCRSFGYLNLSENGPTDLMRARLHVGLGAVPTLTVKTAAEVDNPNPVVAEMLALAVK